MHNSCSAFQSRLTGVRENDPDWTFCVSNRAAFPHYTGLILLSGCSMTTKKGNLRKRIQDRYVHLHFLSHFGQENHSSESSYSIRKIVVPSATKIPENYLLKDSVSHKGREKYMTTSWRREPHCVVNTHVSRKRLFAYFYFPSKIATVV